MNWTRKHSLGHKYIFIMETVRETLPVYINAITIKRLLVPKHSSCYKEIDQFCLGIFHHNLKSGAGQRL